jgi:sulfide:quinone oxidoreductase
VTRSRHAFLPDGVEFIIGEIDRIDADTNKVSLLDGRALPYDFLVISTGATPRPTPKLLCSATTS